MTLQETKTEIKNSPMMQQWHDCKAVAGDALLLFRMGDFYEAFYEDAAILSRELDLTLTKRQEIPMSGVPYHSFEPYIDKLISKGFRVAIAEQVEDPKKAKGLVKREVVRVVTPGTLMTSSLLSETSNNYFAAVVRVGNTFGLALLDLTTADFVVLEFHEEQDLLNEIYRYQPAEFLTSNKFQSKYPTFFKEINQNYSTLLNLHEDWIFEHQYAHDFLVSHLGVHGLDGFGLKGMTAGINAAGGLLQYLQDTLCLPIQHIKEVRTYFSSQYMSIDRTTQRHLELIAPLHEGSRNHTLLGLLNHTATPMGARLLKAWIKQPLLSPEAIKKRQDAVQVFCQQPALLNTFRISLEAVRDIERLMIKVMSGYANPRDLVALSLSLEPIGKIKALLQKVENNELISSLEQRLNASPQLIALIRNAIVEEPPIRHQEGKIFRDGYNRELDELRAISRDSQSWLANYQIQLREITGIKTLKVGFNRMFGYYIEVSKGQAVRMPDTFQRRQTLTNAERFVTPELKEFEHKVLTAEDRILAIESDLFLLLKQEVAKYAQEVMETAQALAILDVLQSFGEVARTQHYCRPVVDESLVLQIREGRHPVIEYCQGNEKFIPNDCFLDDQEQRMMLITGPNMAGKSTYIRQVALIVILAQIGSFIPAKSAHIGIVDKIFTRIGASDDLARGQSTFMVEMTETANILHHATSRSLVILDEIGRGTSTYDGISIAWAVAEYLLLTEGKLAKTLFATHYWELTRLENKIPGIINYHVAVQEQEGRILFLRKIVKGGTDKSYGIHVAKLAGMPFAVINRAKEILDLLEENAGRQTIFDSGKVKKPAAIKNPPIPGIQLTLFEGLLK